jgi:hypothetical protein
MVMRFARVDYRNDNRIFGIKPEDRFSHLYIIGKTGTGKSTLLEAMALQDLKCGNGFALIDPHGDLVERIAKQIPTSRQADVIYLDAANPAQPYGYNPLRHVSVDRIALAASGKESSDLVLDRRRNSTAFPSVIGRMVFRHVVAPGAVPRGRACAASCDS